MALYNTNSSFILSSGKIIFEENEGHNYSHVLLTSTRLKKESIFSATHNEMDSSAIISIVFSSWITSLDSELLIMDNDNYGIFVSSFAE